jgi:putative Mg2+ transporter-C (MgtC) family protein
MALSFPTIVLRLSLALVLGAIIGLERESREHEAGMRTNALIALGCSLFTIISADGFTDLLGQPHIQLDPTRIASYVVAGIGFLGGGAIFVMQDKGRIKGITTAAAIWIVAAIGMACGAGLLWVAVLVTVFALIILVLLRYVERLLSLKGAPEVQRIHLEATGAQEQLVSLVYDTCTGKGLLVQRIEVHVVQGVESLDVTCVSRDVEKLAYTLDALHALSGVQTVEASLQDVKKEYIFVKDPRGS